MTAEVSVLVKTINDSSQAMQTINSDYVEFNAQLTKLAQQEKANAVLAEAKLKFEGLSQAEKDTLIATEALNDGAAEQVQANEGVSLSMTEVNSALAIGKQVIDAVGKAYAATVGKSQAYAQQVREIKAISGQSAEETSRMIQVLDDWQVSAEDVLASTRKLTANGLAPNMETIAKLSDKYLSLNSVEERNKLVTDNLGVSGKKWNDVLSQGGPALRAQAAAVESGLILSEKQLVAAEKLRLSQDKLTDSWNAFSISAGNTAIPALTTSVDYFNTSIEKSGVVTTALNFGFDDLFNIIKGGIDATNSAATSTDTLAQENVKLSQASSAAALSQEEQAAATQRVSDANTAFINSTQTMQNAETAYTEKSKSLADERTAILNKLAVLRQDTSGKSGDAIHSEMVKLQELKDKEKELETERKRQALQFVADELLKQLSVGGLTTVEAREFGKQMVLWGLWSKDIEDKTLAAQSDAQRVVDTIHAIESKSVEISVHTNYTYSGSPGVGNQIPRASGGPVEVGKVYKVGENGPETFVPWQNGTIIPTGGGLSTGGQPSAMTVNTSGNAGGQSGSVVVHLTYAPGVSMHDAEAIKQFVYDGIRAAQADGMIPVGS